MMGISLRNGFVGALMATTAVVGVAPALAADAEDLGLLEAQNLYMHGANVLITEECALKDDKTTVCHMAIVDAGQSRHLTATVTYNKDDKGNITGIQTEAGKSGFYSYDGPSQRHLDIPSGGSITKRVAQERKDFRNARNAQPYSDADYKVTDDRLTRIETAMRKANIFAGELRTIDEVATIQLEGRGVSETSCKLVPTAGSLAKPFDINLTGDSFRAICATHEYNMFEGKSDPQVKTTFSVHSLGADGQLISGSFVDWKRMGDAPNGEIDQTDTRTLKELRKALVGKPTVQIPR